MPEFIWSGEDRYRSNGGNWHELARILEVTRTADGRELVYMERWDENSHPGNKSVWRQRFELSVEFLNSEACGWKKIQAGP